MFFYKIFTGRPASLLHEVGHVGQQSQVAGTLYSLCHTALKLQRVARDATGKDLALLVQELFQKLRILVVYILDTGFLEAAVLLRLLDRSSEASS